MTAIKAKYEGRLVLDFSKGKYSKNKIKQALRKCEIISSKPGIKSNEVTVFLNQIKVGMYTIYIKLLPDSPNSWNKLSQFGDFEIGICDPWGIDLEKDGRFKHQYWVKNNFFGKLRIKHLIDIIAHCIRLNNLKAFL
jgi:hypothetical protein